MPWQTVCGDLTRMTAEAVVNAANSALAQGGGVCGAIFAAAGAQKLTQACRAIGGCPAGQAVITPGFNLPAKYIIHTVGPVWSGGSRGEEELLAACYRSSLALAREKGLKSIAFPLISAGIYGYPKEEAEKVARREIENFLADPDISMDVYLVLRA
ncbi:MAG: macro domain-containing protein [Deltaproteobacteria bacterium]|jgi:O-acetyl-ADP-ribose deacetylase (regulator of RNase III)|nr:macro domain-containing protein [Deltaproteobacteria bacterium]